MNQKEIVDLAEKWLNDVPDIRKKIKLIDNSLNDDFCSDVTIEKLKKERKGLNAKLSMIVKAIGILDEENQRIVCYKYFDKLPDRATALRVGYCNQTVPRRIKKNLLDIGRSLFGFEDEFWNEIYSEK